MRSGHEARLEPRGAQSQQPVGLFEVEAEGLVERPDPDQASRRKAINAPESAGEANAFAASQ